jgi:hypothetical protein
MRGPFERSYSTARHSSTTAECNIQVRYDLNSRTMARKKERFLITERHRPGDCNGEPLLS